MNTVIRSFETHSLQAERFQNRADLTEGDRIARTGLSRRSRSLPEAWKLVIGRRHPMGAVGAAVELVTCRCSQAPHYPGGMEEASKSPFK